ncbi:hypothetical protein IT415_03000 [bacterium]|nr:hypothetical protein [bacterium]
MKQHYWFRAKKYGWGWVPVTWQAWLIVAIWSAIFAGIIALLDLRFNGSWQGPVFSILIGFVWASVLIYISYKKGEPPRWQWGGKKGDT